MDESGIVKVRDDPAWQEQLTEFEADDVSRKFRDFLVFWMEAADKLANERDDSGNNKMGHAKALRKGLELAEQTMGFLSVEWIAQMLLVITQHWDIGKLNLYDELTFIEKRLVDQATAMKLADLQEAASMATEG